MPDSLDSPLSRVTFCRQLQRPMERASDSGTQLGLLIVKLNGLGRTNRNYGYRCGDQLLSAVNHQLQTVARSGDQLVRFSDGVFALVLPGIRGEGHAVLAAGRAERSFQEPLDVGGHSIRVHVSMGIAIFPEHAADAEKLLQCAELALTLSRESFAPYAVYSDSVTDHISRAWDIQTELDWAIEEDELELYYQPKILLDSGQTASVEALMRWHHPDHGMVRPDIFIPVAEQSQQIHDLTWWAINTALRQAQEWEQSGNRPGVAVNMSSSTLQHPDLVSWLEAAMQVWGTPPNALILEITEGTAMSDPETGFERLRQLREIGVRISIDDFGTGYSSLAYFKTLPANEIKIDQTFVKTMLEDEADSHLILAVIQLAHNFGFEVVAEGVESQAVQDALAEMGCDSGQGYHIARPMPHKALLEWLANR